ncbi:hypothetical protein V865_000538 [Kwoniella europaea PYCC6329]|uniref:Cytoplasmic protein n=1 Tax=Kwoniella europaea PYCC6329 TaxID=1423913 RepID=A0AAX4KAG5_9TREE
MEFIPQSDSRSLTDTQQPKNVYPCLAHIHIIPHSDPKATRRLSTGSFGSDEGNALTRVISGGRRKSTDVSNPPPPAGGRRLSFGHKTTESGSTPATGGAEGEIQGKWYWRVQAGVTETHLVLLPLTQPPNPVLTTPPAPLSHAMPSHSTQASAGTRTESGGQEEDGGLIGKMKNLFRRSSTTQRDTSETINTDVGSTPHAQTGVVDTTTSGSAGFGSGAGKAERVIDQTPKGEMLPPAKGNEIGATNLNQNAELGYPGVINGSKLSGVLVPLGAIDKSKIAVGGGKKGEASWVTVPILSHFSQFAQSALGENAPTNKNESYPKSGYIKFEFDKDWIGAKGECELLHHHLTHAISALPESKDRQPHLAQFHLGGGGGKHSPTLPQTREVGPNDESAIEEDDEGPTGTGIGTGGSAFTGTGAGVGTRGAGMGMGGATAATTGTGTGGDIAAGATGDQGIALGHPVAGAGHASEGGSSVSGKVGGE